MQNTTMSCEPKPIAKRKLRFDKTTPGATGPCVESRSLLGLFRLWDVQPTPERRRLPRHEVVESQVWLGWWRGESGFLTSSALIINLSRGGAMIFLDEQPPKDEPVWICMGMPDPVGFVEARVVATQLSEHGQCGARPAHSASLAPMASSQSRHLRTAHHRSQEPPPHSHRRGERGGRVGAAASDKHLACTD